jgi:hypothetical protein
MQQQNDIFSVTYDPLCQDRIHTSYGVFDHEEAIAINLLYSLIMQNWCNAVSVIHSIARKSHYYAGFAELLGALLRECARRNLLSDQKITVLKGAIEEIEKLELFYETNELVCPVNYSKNLNQWILETIKIK